MESGKAALLHETGVPQGEQGALPAPMGGEAAKPRLLPRPGACRASAPVAAQSSGLRPARMRADAAFNASALGSGCAASVAAVTRFRSGSSRSASGSCDSSGSRFKRRFAVRRARGAVSRAQSSAATRYRSDASLSLSGTYLGPGRGAVTRDLGRFCPASRRARPARAGAKSRPVWGPSHGRRST